MIECTTECGLRVNFPNGLGNDNGLLGRYVAFHNYRGSGGATFEGFEDQYYSGRRPTTAFMPSFRNVQKQETDFLRGYMVAFSAGRGRGTSTESFGAALKTLRNEGINADVGLRP